MSMLYVWHPAVIGEELQAIITRGDSDQVGKGSKAFVEALLATVNVTARPSTWRIESFRSNFYSEYWEDGEWDSRWDFIWRIRLRFDAAIPRSRLPKADYRGIDRIDDYSAAIGRYRKSPYAALAVAEFGSEKKATRAAQLIAASPPPRPPRSRAVPDAPKVTIAKLSAGRLHLHAELGSGNEAFFSGGESYSERVLQILQDAGGDLHAKQ